MSTTAHPVTVTEGAWQVINWISEDVDAGIVPWDVPGWSELQDFTDPAVYLIRLAGGEDAYMTDDPELHDWLDDVEVKVAAMLGGKNYPRWDTDPKGYSRWLLRAKTALLYTRAAAFGLTVEQQMERDGTGRPGNLPEDTGHSAAFDLLCGQVAILYPDRGSRFIEPRARKHAEDPGTAYVALCVAYGSEPLSLLTAKIRAREGK